MSLHAASIFRHPVHIAVDLMSLGAIVGVFVQVVPAFAALAAACWYSILIWESETVRRWTDRLEKEPEPIPVPVDEIRDEEDT